MIYGNKASELIRHLTGNHVEIIPEYQHKLVEEILKETEELYAENLKTSQSTSDEQPEEPAAGQPTDDNLDELDGSQRVCEDNVDLDEKKIMVMQVRHTAKLWNKRCIIAYHYERLKRLKLLRWEYGNNLPREILKNLSPDEVEWFRKYNENLFSYMNSLNDGKGIDLTLYITPPKKLYVQVKCLRDYGQFDLEDGRPVMLKKDSIHHLPLSQCEKLIHQGVLEQTSM